MKQIYCVFDNDKFIGKYFYSDIDDIYDSLTDYQKYYNLPHEGKFEYFIFDENNKRVDKRKEKERGKKLYNILKKFIIRISPTKKYINLIKEFNNSVRKYIIDHHNENKSIQMPVKGKEMNVTEVTSLIDKVIKSINSVIYSIEHDVIIKKPKPQSPVIVKKIPKSKSPSLPLVTTFDDHIPKRVIYLSTPFLYQKSDKEKKRLEKDRLRMIGRRYTMEYNASIRHLEPKLFRTETVLMTRT
jgi:hypothetical protein